MNFDNKIDEGFGNAKKPEVIKFYNSTKRRVDMLDMVIDKYSVAKNIRRWLLTVIVFSSKHLLCKFVLVVFSEITDKAEAF